MTPATWYSVRGSNDQYWRVDVPAKAVGAVTVKIPYETGRQQLENPGLGREFCWYLTEEGAEYPDHEGTAVFTRPDKPRAVHAQAMRAQGVLTVAEVDDNYLSDRSLSLAMRYLHDTDDRRRHLEALGCFDRIVVTTPWLRDTYHRELKKVRARGARFEFHVCGNHVDPADWPVRIPRVDRLRVGWMGSPSHVWDVKLAYPALKWAADQGHQVVIVGYDPGWWPQTALKRQGGRLVPDPRHDNPFGFPYTHVPWVDPRDFDRSLAAYPLDVALAPLRRDEHTLGKSDVKYLEYSMSGAATVASSGTVYHEILHGETGLLAGSPREMLRWTQELCRNDRLRDDLASNAAQYIRENRLISQHTHEWTEAVT